MKIKLETTITTVLVLCAVVTTGLVIRREFLMPMTPPARPERKPVFIEEWRTYLAKGARLGLSEAPVQLLEFADFECPFCATLQKDLKTLQERYPTQVALTYIHLPLPMHRFAEPAARAAECAREQDRFEGMLDLLFERQKEFGLRSWSEFANEAGVADGDAFAACMGRPASPPGVVEGKRLAEQLDVPGTPTVVINGWQLGHLPRIDELDGMVRSILAGGSPVESGSQ